MEPKRTVLLAMSGGVDSSVAALLLKKKGYNVIGAFIKCFSDTKNLKGECAWREERRMAGQIATKLSIPLITLDLEREYKKQVIGPMFRAYAQGKTPNPDIPCNRIIKFPLLRKAAKKLKIPLIATGHYARIKKTPSGFQLLSGKDKEKDQSYFLAELNQLDLSRAIFPIGNLTKKQVREIAKKNKFPNWNKKGTRGICFVGKINMLSFLKQKIKEKPGKVISPEGAIIGKHPGIVYFTIGQRLGEHIGVNIDKPEKSAQRRFYVAEKRKGNILIAVPEGHPSLKKKSLFLKNLNLINPKVPLPSPRLKARVRYRGQLYACKLKKIGSRHEFIFNRPARGIAEGQYLVIYKGQQVIGCGEILGKHL